MSISKNEIVEIAAKFFHEKGYHATTMEDISSHFGVTKAALYYHVENKESILCDICDRAMNNVEYKLNTIIKSDFPVVEKIRQFILYQIIALIEEKPIIKVFFTEGNHLPGNKLQESNQRRRRYEEKVCDLFREGINAGIIKDIDVLPVVYGILGMCNWIIQWYNVNGRLTPVQLAEVFGNMILQGLLKETY